MNITELGKLSISDCECLFIFFTAVACLSNTITEVMRKGLKFVICCQGAKQTVMQKNGGCFLLLYHRAWQSLPAHQRQRGQANKLDDVFCYYITERDIPCQHIKDRGARLTNLMMFRCTRCFELTNL